jgi:uncharacterized protein YebE (UPF0316 family)
MDTLLGALATGGAAATSISLWTFRVALAGRGRRVFSAVIAGIEAVLFVVVFTGLVANLGDPVRLVAYAFGVALGTLLGLVADDRLSSGHSEVRLVVVGDGAEALATLRGAGWPATSTPGSGPEGPATSVFVVVDDRRRHELLALVGELEPTPFVTVEQLRETRPGPLPAGFIQLGERPPRRRTRVVATATAPMRAATWSARAVAGSARAVAGSARAVAGSAHAAAASARAVARFARAVAASSRAVAGSARALTGSVCASDAPAGVAER